MKRPERQFSRISARLACAGLTAALCGCTTPKHNPDQITHGVSKLISANIPGPVSGGPAWRPLVRGTMQSATNPVPVVLGRPYGRGRVALTSVEFKAANDGGEFKANFYRWLAGTKRGSIAYTTGHREFRLLTDTADYADGETVRRLGLHSKPLTAPVTSNQLSGVSVVFVGIAWQEITAEEIETLRQFVWNGGGLYLMGLGWSWLAYHPTNTMSDYPMEKAAAPYDGHWLDGVVDNGQTFSQTPEKDGFTVLTHIGEIPPSKPSARRGVSREGLRPVILVP